MKIEGLAGMTQDNLGFSVTFSSHMVNLMCAHVLCSVLLSMLNMPLKSVFPPVSVRFPADMGAVHQSDKNTIQTE